VRAAEGCTVAYDKVAGPGVVLLGEDVGVTLTVRAWCPPPPAHLVLVMDVSASMMGYDRTMKDAASALVRAIDLASHPETRVGVVAAGDRTTLPCPMSGDEDQLLRCIERLPTPDGGTRLDAGIDRAVSVMAAREDDWAPRRPTEIVMVFSDGRNTGGCDAVVRAAAAAKARGILMVSLGVGADIDDACMRMIASSARYYCPLRGIDCGLRFEDALLGRAGLLVVTDTVSADVWFVTGSARPDPAYSESGVKAWRFAVRGDTLVTMSLRVRTWIPGTVRTNDSARGTLLEPALTRTDWEFPVPEVTVLEPDMPTAPSATGTAGPSATSSTTPPATPPTVRPPVVQPLYVPHADR
jgi:hypothetical protein